jgi:hypothetical protein
MPLGIGCFPEYIGAAGKEKLDQISAGAINRKSMHEFGYILMLN